MPLFSPLRWWRARRKQKRLNEAFWGELREPAPHLAPDLEKLQALVQAGADVNCNEGSIGDPPLYYAARRNHCTVDTVRFLLENGADVKRLNEINPRRPSPSLPWAAHGGGRYGNEKFHLLFEAGADVNACDPLSGRSVIWELTTWASVVLLENVLKRGAKLNSGGFNQWKWKPLHTAAYLGRPDVVELYLRYGADPFARDKSGCTPRMLAENNGPTEPPGLKTRADNLQECARLLLAAEQENKG